MQLRAGNIIGGSSTANFRRVSSQIQPLAGNGVDGAFTSASNGVPAEIGGGASEPALPMVPVLSGGVADTLPTVSTTFPLLPMVPVADAFWTVSIMLPALPTVIVLGGGVLHTLGVLVGIAGNNTCGLIGASSP